MSGRGGQELAARGSERGGERSQSPAPKSQLPAPAALLAWSPDPLAAEYNLYRGTRGDLADLACFLPGVASTSTPDDGAVPPSGGLYVYLVTAANCRGESTLGWSTSGAERSASSPCP